MTDRIDLFPLHYALHDVTGSMALRWLKATPADLEAWAAQLRAIADQMDAVGASDDAADRLVARNENVRLGAVDPFGAPPPWMVP